MERSHRRMSSSKIKDQTRCRVQIGDGSIQQWRNAKGNDAKSKGDETEGECQEASGVTGLKSNQLRLTQEEINLPLCNPLSNMIR